MSQEYDPGTWRHTTPEHEPTSYGDVTPVDTIRRDMSYWDGIERMTPKFVAGLIEDRIAAGEFDYSTGLAIMDELFPY